MIYTVVLNSKNNSGTSTIQTNRGTRYYNIDWSFLPQGKKYKVSFTFKSTRIQTTALTADTLIQLNVNFTGSPNTYVAVPTGGRNVSNLLGVIYVENVSDNTDQRYQALLTDNLPIFLNDRPSNNQFLVQMYGVGGVEYVTPNTAGLEYILTLLFEEMD